MATRVTTLTLSRGVLADTTAASLRLARTQQKLASGKELVRPSDDPSAVARAIELRTQMEGAQNYQRTVSDAQGWATVTDSALETMVTSLQRARELTLQGANGPLDAKQREAIAIEVDALIDSMKQAGNANYGGRYVFAGTLTGAPPYTMGASDAYGGDTQPVLQEIGPGVALRVNAIGSDVIGDDTSGLLQALRTIKANLLSGNTTALASTDVQALDAGLDKLNLERAKIGATASRLDVAEARLAEYEGTTLKLLSNTEDADFAKTMIDFSVQKSALEAGLKAGANIVQTSLLDFLR